MKKSFRILFVATLAATTHAGIPAIRAKVSEPVLIETMGGYSVKCAFGWTAETQVGPGQKRVKINVLNDDDAESAWVAPGGSSGVGTKFKFIFPKKLLPELESTPLYGLDLINGVWKSEEQWKAHGRVRKARLYYNDAPFRDLLFADNRRWQRTSFPDISVRSGDSMTFEILEIYPGEHGAGAAITEIVLQGAH